LDAFLHCPEAGAVLARFMCGSSSGGFGLLLAKPFDLARCLLGRSWFVARVAIPQVRLVWAVAPLATVFFWRWSLCALLSASAVAVMYVAAVLMTLNVPLCAREFYRDTSQHCVEDRRI
jgi:hypothetical protein